MFVASYQIDTERPSPSSPSQLGISGLLAMALPATFAPHPSSCFNGTENARDILDALGSAAALRSRHASFLFPSHRHNTTHGLRTVWPAHGPHFFQIPAFPSRRSALPPPIPVSTHCARAQARAYSLLPVESTAVQCVQHVVVGAGPATRVAWVQHIAHVQPTALSATRSGGRWGRGCGCAGR